MSKSLIEKINEVCRYYGYDLEVVPTMLDCALTILFEVRAEIVKEVQ